MKLFKTQYLLSGLLLLASCTGSSTTEITLYDDAAITSFSLGRMNRYVNGEKSTYAGSTYKFYIDHITHEIYNPDSLPKGTDVKHALCTVAALNNGQVMIEHDENADTLYFYSATDSVDLSRTRYFRVYSSRGTGYSRYSVKVNVHKEDADKMVWKKVASLPKMVGVKPIYFNGGVYVFGNQDGALKAYRTDNEGASWEPLELPSAFTKAEDWDNLATNHEAAYFLTDSRLYQTRDMQNWTELQTNILSEDKLSQLLAVGSAEMYAMSEENGIMASFIGYDWWYKDNCEEIDMLPTQDISTVVYPLNLSDSTDVILMGGNKLVERNGKQVWRTMFWRKIMDYSETGAISDWKQTGILGGQWIYMDRDEDYAYDLPPMEDMQLLYYDKVLIALGGFSMEEEVDGVPCRRMFKSRDNGITWKLDESYSMPPIDAKTDEVFSLDVSGIAAIVDDNGFIWLFGASTGEVWRGRINRLGWNSF